MRCPRLLLHHTCGQGEPEEEPAQASDRIAWRGNGCSFTSTPERNLPSYFFVLFLFPLIFFTPLPRASGIPSVYTLLGVSEGFIEVGEGKEKKKRKKKRQKEKAEREKKRGKPKQPYEDALV